MNSMTSVHITDVSRIAIWHTVNKMTPRFKVKLNGQLNHFQKPLVWECLTKHGCLKVFFKLPFVLVPFFLLSPLQMPATCTSRTGKNSDSSHACVLHGIRNQLHSVKGCFVMEWTRWKQVATNESQPKVTKCTLYIYIYISLNCFSVSFLRDCWVFFLVSPYSHVCLTSDVRINWFKNDWKEELQLSDMM